MIDYIKYIIDGTAYNLVSNGDGTWSRDLNAPYVAGKYNLQFEIGQQGIVTYIDSSDPRYTLYLEVIEEIERKVNLIKGIRIFLRDDPTLKAMFSSEDAELDQLHNKIKNIGLDLFIRTAGIEKITNLESFLGFKGQGSLAQRRTYLLALFQKSRKLNENLIKEITHTITGSDCIVTFFGSDELDNPEPNHALLRVQVLTPSNESYRYDDIARSLKPLVPANIKLVVIRYFATWDDIRMNFQDWNAVMSMDSWQAIKDYIPPQ